MAPTGYERLSAQDSSFLQFEREGNPVRGRTVEVVASQRLDQGIVGPDLKAFCGSVKKFRVENVEPIVGIEIEADCGVNLCRDTSSNRKQQG